MPHLCCLLETGYKEEDAWEELARQGLQNPYSLSDPLTGEVKLFGEMEKFKLWLDTPNFSLGNLKPMELLKDSYGKELVISELTRINYGILV